MVRMLATENATQRGSTAAASLDAIAAICKVLAYNLLRWEDQATFSRNLEKLPIDFPSCRGRLEAGDGIGEPCVKAFAPEGSFSSTQIIENLAVLKDSGRMATIIAEAGAKADVELAAARRGPGPVGATMAPLESLTPTRSYECGLTPIRDGRRMSHPP
jgi:hypothetical protein